MYSKEQLREFEDIRPYEADELQMAYEKLFENDEFKNVLKYLYPEIPIEIIEKNMRKCSTNIQFQKEFPYVFLKNLLQKASTGCKINVTALNKENSYTFISNHRDIVLDSGFLDIMLFDEGWNKTCEIAIGSNLLKKEWIKTLVKINKSFIIKRDLSPKELLLASKKVSKYIRFVIQSKQDNVWIAQREGRAKDSNDRTQTALLKMLTLEGKGNLKEKFKELNIVPLSISYEYDPCDYLKAKELYDRSMNDNYIKGENEDIISMQTGIMGYKGNINYHCSPCINDWIDSIKDDMSNAELIELIAKYIDKEIHKNYKIHPINIIAYDIIHNNNTENTSYSEEEKQKVLNYIRNKMDKKLSVEAQNKIEYIMLNMYSNIYENYLEANKK